VRIPRENQTDLHGLALEINGVTSIIGCWLKQLKPLPMFKEGNMDTAKKSSVKLP
jgi:hypothetical protein